jgi:endonuclease YncB( thermonuclease family)
VVTKVVDEDTVDVNDVRVRLALVNTAEKEETKYTEAKEFVKSVRGIGTKSLVDEDDGQTNGSYNRMVSLVYCGGWGRTNIIIKLAITPKRLRKNTRTILRR